MKRQHSLIVGGTRGSGRVLVRTLAKQDHRLSVIGRRVPSELYRQNPNVAYWSVDLSSRERLLKVLREIVRKNGKLNNLVFFQRYRGDGDNWIGEINTSLTATKDVIELLANDFDSSSENFNSIVIISSLASSLIAEEQPLSYHVAKAGLNQMVRYYAVLLGPKGIRTNGVSPGAVLKEEARDFYLSNAKLYNLYKRFTPLRRMGTSEDIAHVIAFLCSPQASFITGQNIVVDGGLSLQWQESLARVRSLQERGVACSQRVQRRPR